MRRLLIEAAAVLAVRTCPDDQTQGQANAYEDEIKRVIGEHKRQDANAPADDNAYEHPTLCVHLLFFPYLSHPSVSFSEFILP
jgi:hypothetical protein